MQSKRFKKLLFALADIVFFYAGLFLALAVRYGEFPSGDLWLTHQWPFLIVFAVWLVIFYIAGLYDMEKFLSLAEIRNRAFKTMLAAGTIAIILFYLVPSFGVTPKTNLLIDGLITFILVWLWRSAFFGRTVRSSKIKIYFLGGGKEISEFANFLEKRPQLGYKNTENFPEADIIIISGEAKKNPEAVESLYETIRRGKTVIDFDKFYESITGKIPVYLVSKAWFLENLMEISKQTFEKSKRAADVIFASLLLIPFLIICPFAALAIKLNSRGSVFYKQRRVGKDGKIFEIVKFRSMVQDAEKNGAEWAKKEDERATFAGKILRKTRIDELPQIWNVLKNELSFVGPRPERPEFVKELERQIPHYSMRHLVKPGLSGWAQINFPYGASVEDATEKLQYDLYYIKNRSLLLEISIILKTIMTLLSRTGI